MKSVSTVSSMQAGGSRYSHCCANITTTAPELSHLPKLKLAGFDHGPLLPSPSPDTLPSASCLWL